MTPMKSVIVLVRPGEGEFGLTSNIAISADRRMSPPAMALTREGTLLVLTGEGEV